MKLIIRVKSLLVDKGMSFTDLAEKMNASRSSLYRSIQTESIRYSTLQRVAVALDVEVYRLVTTIDVQDVDDLEGEIFVFLNEMNQLSRQLVKLKYGKITINEIQEDFDPFARSTQLNWPKRLLSMEEIENLYNLRKNDESE